MVHTAVQKLLVGNASFIVVCTLNATLKAVRQTESRGAGCFNRGTTLNNPLANGKLPPSCARTLYVIVSEKITVILS